MSTPNFVDHVTLYARSGNGGAGAVHFRREKFVAKGGPDGGNGGRGGHIIVQGNKQLSTLLHLRYRKHVIAPNGYPGSRNKQSGARGNDIILQVPLGTVVQDNQHHNTLLEVNTHGTSRLLLQGGQGGLGNAHFKSATQQTPRYAQSGRPGVEQWLNLELKLLAEVGLVGQPNAGKSTLLSIVTAAKPKIASYPFTTLVPQLGIVSYGTGQSFTMADIPGLIAGASSGKGLGSRFLKHIERNAILLFVIAADTSCIAHTYTQLMLELQRHNPHLMHKPKLLVITKVDLMHKDQRDTLYIPQDIDHTLISSVTGEGIKVLKHKLWALLQEVRRDNSAGKNTINTLLS